jgi:hypothetical protein
MYCGKPRALQGFYTDEPSKAGMKNSLGFSSRFNVVMLLEKRNLLEHIEEL